MTDTITMPRSVVERALQSLHLGIAMYPNGGTAAVTIQATIDALRAALEQSQVEQEPVAWIEHEWSGSGLRHLHFERPAPTVRDEVVRPVWTPLYTRPQPKRQPLTEMEIVELRQLTPGTLDVQFVKFARSIEAAHGVKGRK